MSEQQEQIKLKEHKTLSEAEKLRLSNVNLQLELLAEKRAKLELEYQMANANVRSFMASTKAAHYPNAKDDEVMLDPQQGIIGLIDKSEAAQAKPEAEQPKAEEPKAAQSA